MSRASSSVLEGREPSLGAPRKAGPVGRLLRLGAGLATLSLLYSLLLEWPGEMWAGRLPFSDPGFLVLVGLALGLTSYVVNILFQLEWGQKTVVGILLVAVAAAAIGGVASGEPINAALGIYLWLWFVLFTGLLGSAFVLAAVLGTPGCEMRSFAHLRTLSRGGNADTVACPGCIDRFDHIGQ